MNARDLVTSLAERGLRVRWRRGAARLLGDLGKLTPADYEAIQKNRKELETFAQWRKLQEDSEAQFGWAGARLYPFQAADSRRWWEGPRVRTPLGLAHLVQVQVSAAWVVRRADVKQWLKDPDPGISARPYAGPSHFIAHHEIWPPSKPPEVACGESKTSTT